MKSTTIAIASLVSGAALMSGVAADSSNFGRDPTPNPYYYSEINCSDDYSNNYDNFMDTADEEEQQQQQDNYSDFDDMSDSASVVSSSLVYEGGCFVSSQAMMCNGGENSLSLLDTYEYDSDEEIDSDDEDDDEDDGHSSMLSNASLHRSKFLVGGPATGSSSKGNQRGPVSNSATAYFEKEVRLNQKSTIRPTFLARRGSR